MTDHMMVIQLIGLKCLSTLQQGARWAGGCGIHLLSTGERFSLMLRICLLTG
jgi:hypothetical protein